MSYNTQAWSQVRPSTGLSKTRKKIIIPAFQTLATEENNLALDVGFHAFLGIAPDYLYGVSATMGAILSDLGVATLPIQIDFWVKPGNLVTGLKEVCYVFSRGFNQLAPATTPDFQIKILRTGEVSFFTKTAGGPRTTVSTAKVVRNEWNHVGVQWHGSGTLETIRIFVNGVKFEFTEANAVTSLTVLSDMICIGNPPVIGDRLDLLSASFHLDELRFWVEHQPDSYFQGLIPNFARSTDDEDNGLDAYWDFNTNVESVIAINSFTTGDVTRNAEGYPNVLSARSFPVTTLPLTPLAKNFALKFPIDLGTTNYSLLVSWTDGDTFKRRLLHRGQNLITYTPITDYAGETIDYSNGQLEIWNDHLEHSITGVLTTLETSILQDVIDLNGTPLDNAVTLNIDTGLWHTLDALPMAFNAINYNIQ